MKRTGRDPSPSPTPLPESAPAPAGPAGRVGPFWLRRPLFWSLLLLLVFTGGMMVSAGMDLKAFNFFRTLTPEPVAPTADEEPISAPGQALTLRALPLHPDQRYAALFQRFPSRSPGLSSTRQAAFLSLLDRYVTRQGNDDNFTIRVLDDRTGETLEVFVLDALRQAYSRGEDIDWQVVDKQRAKETRRLVEKYRKLGLPKHALVIRWGRANQVREARRREAPYLAHELALAHHLGLSLLATEIGTVETFNQDHLVSRAGARSRYQLMPYHLRQSGVEHYRLPTASGGHIRVYEEWHPLLTMEPAFVLMRAYANALGHELPGLAAYHAGPYNLFKLYRSYLTHAEPEDGRPPHVVDALVWGMTDGYPIVRRSSTFRSRSRGYIPAAYGALRAVEDLPIDTSLTLRATRVRLRPGRTLLLSDLLGALAATRLSFDWGPGSEGRSLYNRFRLLNPHMVLPEAPDSTGVPPAGDVRLVARTPGADVAFFLPPGAAEALVRHGIEAIDPAEIRYLGPEAYAPSPGEKTVWDEAYEALVEDIGYFGFTEAHRARLDTLRHHFSTLARTHPTPYRQRQLRIIELHARVWDSRFWRLLARTVEAHKGRLRAPVRPPVPLPAQ